MLGCLSGGCNLALLLNVLNCIVMYTELSEMDALLNHMCPMCVSLAGATLAGLRSLKLYPDLLRQLWAVYISTHLALAKELATTSFSLSFPFAWFVHISWRLFTSVTSCTLAHVGDSVAAALCLMVLIYSFIFFVCVCFYVYVYVSVSLHGLRMYFFSLFYFVSWL